MTKAFAQAIARRPPRGQGSGEPGAAVVSAVGLSSGAAVPLNLPLNGSGQYYTFIANTDCHVRFGLANVSAATTSDFLIPAGVPQEFWCEGNEDTHFRCVASSVAGSMFWFQSSR